MEDIVAVELMLENGERRYFMTWGRIQAAVDGRPLAELVLKHQRTYALGGRAVRARVCWSLQDAADQPYFYEALFSFASEPIPFGPDYEAWRQSKAESMARGREMAYLGKPFPPKAARDLISDFWERKPRGASEGYYRHLAEQLRAEGWLHWLFDTLPATTNVMRMTAIIQAASDPPDDHPRLRPFLGEQLDDDRPEVVVEAVRGLQRIGATNVLCQHSWLRSHRSPRVRKAVAAALGA